VEESVAEEVITKLKYRMQHLIVGAPLDKNTDIGAINNAAQLKKIQGFLKEAKEEGLDLYSATETIPKQGLYCSPTLVLGAGQSHRIVQEEIFGPVLCVQTFRTIDEVIEKANATPYGLSAGIWSEKGARALGMASKLRAGVIWANGFNLFDPASAFGGYKESGFGREGGIAGLLPYLQMR
jgi:aldehyde dehydrogenase (NAD+)